MNQALTPTQTHAEPLPLLTKAQLMKWLQVSDMWVRMRLADDPQFVDRCVVDISTPGSSRKTLRFSKPAVAAYLGIPADDIATLAVA